MKLDNKLNVYISRLLEEWKTYGKIVIACDWDDTLKNWKLNTFDTYDKVLNLLRECKQTGCYIVIHTACNEDRYNEITKFCEAHGILIDGINKTVINVPYGKEGSKIYYNHQLCDRSGLLESLDILESALYQYRSYLQQSKPATDVA